MAGSGFRKTADLFLRNRMAALGLIIIGLEVLVGIFAPVLAPYDPSAINLPDKLLSPGQKGHLLGTDRIGRDLLSRIIYGTRLSLIEGVVIVALSLTLTIPLGCLAGYYRRLDSPIMRLMDVLLAFPAMLLGLLVVGVLGTSFVNVLLASALAGVAPATVFFRTLVISVKSNQYVEAARVVGARDGRIIFRHILPNVLPSIIVSATFRAGTAVLFASGFSFLGLGVKPPTPEWGAMLSAGRGLLYQSPHVAAFPGLAIMITVLAFNYLGDGLREATDPRLRGR